MKNHVYMYIYSNTLYLYTHTHTWRHTVTVTDENNEVQSTEGLRFIVEDSDFKFRSSGSEVQNLVT